MSFWPAAKGNPHWRRCNRQATSSKLRLLAEIKADQLKLQKPILAAILLAGAASASDAALEKPVPQEKPVHKFFDKTTKSLLAWNVAAQSFDAVTTRHFLDTNYAGTQIRLGNEFNPLSRPLESKGWSGSIAYHYGLNLGGTLFAQWMLHQTGHHKLERWLAVYAAGSSTACAIVNLRFYGPQTLHR